MSAPRTDPRMPSPPLPVDTPPIAGMPLQADMIAETRRAAVELVWALHRQRTAWAKLARIKKELTGRNVQFMDNERPYKLAVGDVQWWRGEVSSRANALTALLAALELYKQN